MRLVLASSALVITWLDPTQPDRYVFTTYTALILYTLYSATLHVLTLRRSTLVQSFGYWEHWADVAWYLIIIALSSGTSSIFFFFFFFSILVAAFRWGFSSGIRVTITSAALFTIIGYLTAPPVPDFELNRFLLRPIYLLVLGYMFAFWGEHEIILKRRLSLLNDVNTLSNPRFGVDHTMGRVLEQIRAFYDAELCLIITPGENPDGYEIRCANKHDPEAATCPTPMTPEIARLVFFLPRQQALFYSRRAHWWHDHILSAYDVVTHKAMPGDLKIIDNLATVLDTDHLISIPVHDSNGIAGRLCLTSRNHILRLSDIGFIIQVMEQVTPMIENIRLVDVLASDAAETERQRIARDIHDSVIQPYIGLQIGLAGIRRKAAAGSEPDSIVKDLDYLIDLTETSVDDLRCYAQELKHTGGHDGSLVPAIRRFTSKFTKATGIAIEVVSAQNLHVPDRLAAEIFQIASEGLSNIRRHTEAVQARIALVRQDGNLIVSIENESPCNTMHHETAPDGERRTARFTPVSITERAEALGGKVQVEERPDGGTAVIVKVPL